MSERQKESNVPSFNRVILMGHLGHEPEVRRTQKGQAVTNFRIATTRRWKDAESGERREATEWHRIVLFGKQAEIFGDRAAKGALIQVEGSLQTRDWTDRDGNKRYTTETVARLVQVLGKREHPVTEPPASEEPPTPPEAEVPEDDIPF
jgi:single-strand DNA-binding protein